MFGPVGEDFLSASAFGQQQLARHAEVGAQRVNDLLEKHCERIAQTVQDETGQLLAAVFLRLEEASRELPDNFVGCFRDIRQMLELIELQLHEISYDLRPAVLDDLGLVPATQGLVDRASKRHGITVTLSSALPGSRLQSAVETTLYRMAQECLTNIVKHAKATHVAVRFTFDGAQVGCSIRDNGAGFDVKEALSRKGQRGLGLAGIRERVESLGGVLLIHSLAGAGTEMLAEIPLGVMNADWDCACR
jgi:signal transduction histidine kinase